MTDLRSAITAAFGLLAKREIDAAVRSLREIARANGSSPVAHDALGIALGHANAHEEAEACFRAALALSPGRTASLTNLGGALIERGRHREALGVFEEARRAPNAPPAAHGGYAIAVGLLGDQQAAAEALDVALRDLRAPAELGSQRCYAAQIDASASDEAVVAVHRAFEARFARGAPPLELRPRRAPPRPRIGYVTADARDHAVASFLEPVLAGHDRGAFAVHLYADHVREDAVSARLKAHVDAWIPVAALDDEALAKRLVADELDVVIDLAGHMHGNRLRVFARRPAAVLATYLGYPGTTGLAVFDARITDEMADPSTTSAAIAGPEPCVRVPSGAWAYRPPPDAPEPAAIDDDARGFAFGSFNHTLKLNRRVIALWSRVLRAVPAATLVLKSLSLASTDVRDALVEAFEAEGIDRRRLTVFSPPSSRAEHLRRYDEVDLALDPFPYNGVTTTCEALLMGVPTLALLGTRHASRVAASLLSRVGLDAFVTPNEDAYVEQAIVLARRGPRSLAERRSLRARLLASSLVDGRPIAATIETLARSERSAIRQED